jgi:hypothetical protein
MHSAMLKRSMRVIETSMAAATTIAARMPMLTLAAVGGSPSTRQLIEAQRMVTEKAEAAVAGALAAGSAWTGMWLRLGLGMIRPHQAAEEAARVMDAACAPAIATCRKNARRVTRKPQRRSGKRRRS